MLHACNPGNALTFIPPFYSCCLHFSALDDSVFHRRFIVLYFPSPLGFPSSFKERVIKKCTETIIQTKAGNILYGKWNNHEVKFRRREEKLCSSSVPTVLFTLIRPSHFILCFWFLFLLKDKKKCVLWLNSSIAAAHHDLLQIPLWEDHGSWYILQRNTVRAH